jgi:hypothetical protein
VAKKCQPSDWWRTVVLSLTRALEQEWASVRIGLPPLSSTHWPLGFVVERRLGEARGPSGSLASKSRFFAGPCGWACGWSGCWVARGMSSLPGGDICGRGPACQRRFLGPHRNVLRSGLLVRLVPG